MLIPLICNQCGGKLEVEDSRVSISGNTITALTDQNIECPHCGTRYISGEMNRLIYATGGSIAIGNISFGEVNGNVVIRSGVSPDSSSVKSDESTSSDHSVVGNEVKVVTPLSTKKQTKKWWEFWK